MIHSKPNVSHTEQSSAERWYGELAFRKARKHNDLSFGGTRAYKNGTDVVRFSHESCSEPEAGLVFPTWYSKQSERVLRGTEALNGPFSLLYVTHACNTASYLQVACLTSSLTSIHSIQGEHHIVFKDISLFRRILVLGTVEYDSAENLAYETHNGQGPSNQEISFK